MDWNEIFRSVPKIENKVNLTLFKSVFGVEPSINFGGNLVPIPRLNVWFGDSGKSYTYSGIRLNPMPWNDVMLEVKSKDGNDSVSWHQDDEPELGEGPIIASLSLGGTRTFKLKNVKTGEVKKFELENDSLLLMGSGIQKDWVHSIPKTKKLVSPRINITFRNIVI